MVRLEKIITLAAYFSGLTNHAALKHRIPILMYHSIIEGHPRKIHQFYFSTETTIQRFEEQMAVLHEGGYQTLTMKEMSALSDVNPPNHSIVITFDDGFEDFYLNAFPILKKYGIKSTVYLPTSKIGLRENGLENKAHLSWDTIKILNAQGVEFGSHTVNHPQLFSCSKNQIVEELKQSKEELEHHLGQRIFSFAYPYAFPEHDLKFTEFFIDALRKAEYHSNATTIIGTASVKTNPFLLPRIPINDWDDLSFFRGKLSGAYNWMHIVQLLKKQIRWSK